MIRQLKAEMEGLADPVQAANLARFFKMRPTAKLPGMPRDRSLVSTGRGEYGEGDVFLGIKVPVQRRLARKYGNMALDELEALLESGIHEHRLTALLILVARYRKAGRQEKRRIVRFYLSHLGCVNNWDLVDLSAPGILGDHLARNPSEKALLGRLAKSRNIWKRRAAMLATFAFIREGDFSDSIMVAEMLLHDDEDLIHKAAGWALREVGKRDEEALTGFLDRHCAAMPRTMLRYAIERLPAADRKLYLGRRAMHGRHRSQKPTMFERN